MAINSATIGRPCSLVDLRYYLIGALRSCRRDRFLTISIVLTLAVGIAASMTVFSILHILSGDPIPQKSARLFQPTIASGGRVEESMPHRYSIPDAQRLIEQLRPPERGAIMAQGFAGTVGSPGRPTQQQTLLRFTTSPFFNIFSVPFLQGGPWNASADVTAEHVAVLGRAFAKDLFGTTSALGKVVTLGGLSFHVVGVMDDWHPIPRFYDLTTGAYTPADSMYVPLTSIRDMNSEVSLGWWSCSDATSKVLETGHFAPLLGPECQWVSVWVEISTPQGQRRFAAFLEKTLGQMKVAGHAAPSDSSSLPNVLQTLEVARVVPGDIRAYTVMGFLFLLLCVLSATGTLLGKFSRRSCEIGIRRALGASRTDILIQFLVEAGLLGVGGGAFGVLFAELSLTAIRHAPTYLSQVVGMSIILLMASVCLAVLCGTLAGLMPAWRAARTDIGIILRVT